MRVTCAVLSAQSRGWVCAGARMRQPFAALRVPCGARSRGPSRNSLHSLRSLRSNNRDESEHDARAGARGHEPCAPRRRICRCRRTPTHGFAGTTVPLSSNTTSAAARRAVPGGGDLWGGEKRSSAVGARERALRASDSPRLFERNERSECSEFLGATALRASQRSRPARPTATVGAPTGHRPPRRTSRLQFDAKRATGAGYLFIQSSFAPDAFTTSAQRLISLLTNPPKSAPYRLGVSAPRLFQALLISSSAGERLLHLGLHVVDDVFRRALRRPQAVPGGRPGSRGTPASMLVGTSAKPGARVATPRPAP